MIHGLEKALSEYELIEITESNFDQAMEIYHSNQVFFRLTQGEETTRENSIHDIQAVPPNYNIEGKLYISIWEQGKIIGVLDLLTGYPTKQCVWIGLLLIHGALHRKKYGSAIAQGILEAAQHAGYEAIQLGVLRKNEIRIDFWRKHGFTKIREAKPSKDHPNSMAIIVMEKQIG